MKVFVIDEMVRGWFVGNFTPTAHATKNCEVAVKGYQAGDFEEAHYHKVATEITHILSGEVRMNGIDYKKGTILVIEPGERTDFLAVTDAITVVVKTPGATNDKYID